MWIIIVLILRTILIIKWDDVCNDSSTVPKVNVIIYHLRPAYSSTLRKITPTFMPSWTEISRSGFCIFMIEACFCTFGSSIFGHSFKRGFLQTKGEWTATDPSLPHSTWRDLIPQNCCIHRVLKAGNLFGRAVAWKCVSKGLWHIWPCCELIDGVMGEASKGPPAQACFPYHHPRDPTNYTAQYGWDAQNE